jgi:hypothetical protein
MTLMQSLCSGMSWVYLQPCIGHANYHHPALYIEINSNPSNDRPTAVAVTSLCLQVCS